MFNREPSISLYVVYMDMKRDHYISITRDGMKAYRFPVELEQEDDGRWSARIETLPGCARICVTCAPLWRALSPPHVSALTLTVL